MPRSHVNAGSNTHEIDMRHSGSAERAIPRGEEEDKEERRRSVLLPRCGRRRTARPSSLHTNNDKRKRATGKIENVNELTSLSIKHPLRNKCQLLTITTPIGNPYCIGRIILLGRRLILLAIIRLHFVKLS